MGLKEWFRKTFGGGKAETKEVTARELCDAAREIQIRELAFQYCVNLVANAIGRAEFRTYFDGVEIKDREYYMLNVEPNRFQNSTAFLHRLISQLFQKGECLIIPLSFRDGAEGLAVVENFSVRDPPQWKNYDMYENITVRGQDIAKTFREDDVLHLILHDRNVKPLINGIYESYQKLLQAAMNNYIFSNGQHWQVKVDRLPYGYEDKREEFQKMITSQMSAVLNSETSVLIEENGYEYQPMGGNSGSYGKAGSSDSSGITALIQDIFSMTARAFLIPPALITGNTQDANDSFTRFLTCCIDPIADQLSEELTRKRYGFDAWKSGTRVVCDTSSLRHVDLFDNAAHIEKLIGSGFSMNDVRKAMGQPEIHEDWADQHMITKNFTDLEQILKEGETA